MVSLAAARYTARADGKADLGGSHGKRTGMVNHCCGLSAIRALAGTALRCGAMVAALAAGGPAFALDPSRSLVQLHHTAWTIEDGAPPDVWALAQSQDGYLWLGTGAGLYRFDGVRFEKISYVGGTPMPATNINALCATPSGDIWIGYVTGDIALLRQGRLFSYKLDLPRVPVNAIVQDGHGNIWAALKGFGEGGLARFTGGRWQILGADWGLPAGGTSSVLAAADGAVWVTTHNALFVLRPGTTRFLPTGEKLLDHSLVTQSPDGRIWLSSGVGSGIYALADQAGQTMASRANRPVPPAAPEPEVSRMIFDHDGALWGTYQVGGIFRIGPPAQAAPVSEKFTLQERLSSNLATPLLEDREGNIWVGTNLGLDRFRATNAAALAGVPATQRHGFFIARSDVASVDVAAGDSLFQVASDGHVDLLARLPSLPRFLARDRDGILWIGLLDGMETLTGKGLQRVALPADADGEVYNWAQDGRGRICISVLESGIFCDDQGHWAKRGIPLGEGPSETPQLAFDRRNRLWMTRGDGVAVLESGTLHAFSAKDGLGVGKVEIMAPDGDGVFVGGEFGLARFDGDRFTTLSSARYPALNGITGIVTTQTGKTWLHGMAGVVRVDTDALMNAFKSPEAALKYEIFDLRDGMPGVAQQDSDTPTAIEGKGGRLWFATSHGMASIDPGRLVHNALAPPVSIQSVRANGKAYDAGSMPELPEGAADLEIGFTALSLSIPERVRFRYRLDGVDADWTDPGTRRQAFYTKLGPGRYRFHVVAANNDGVWNTQGATLDFVIPPSFVQSVWFKMVVVAALASLLWVLYAIRVRQVTERLRGRLEERLGERERIARELHDTLLQGFQGLVYQFQAAADQMPQDHRAQQRLEAALNLADGVLAEGRRRVLNLRADLPESDIAQAFAATAERLGAEEKGGFHIAVRGRVRALHPVVKEEISRIFDEALANALRHAAGETIVVTLTYAFLRFTVSIHDDGVGLDPAIVRAGQRPGHFGLVGMRERARSIRGLLRIVSSEGLGTEIAVLVPASIAYARRGNRRHTIHGTAPVREI